MRNASVWQAMLGLAHTVIEGVELDDQSGALVVSVRPRKGKRRCGRCGQRSPLFDRGEGRRRWRSLDLGEMRVYLEAAAPRVSCSTHGPTVAQVPWARHDAGHTRAFDDTVAWLAVQCSKTAITELMRVAWRTVGSIITRVSADIDAKTDRLGGLRRIGINEISYKRGYRYLTVVVDHDSGRLVWAAAGRDDATLHRFFDLLGDQRTAEITHVSADAADWIRRVVTRRCPHAELCADPFHVVAWATEALDQVRRQAWNAASGRRRAGEAVGTARAISRARYALWKNPDNLTTRQREQIAWIAKCDPRLHEAYLLKEGLRYVLHQRGQPAKDALEGWLGWALESNIEPFVKLAAKIQRNRAAIEATLEHGLSNALIESTNTKIRLLTRIAFGFHSANALIALAMLALGGTRPQLPGRN